MVKVAATPPARLKKNVGLSNVPQRIEPRRTLNTVTINASRKPRNTIVTRVITLANPSLIHGEGNGISASKRWRTIPRATINARVVILRLGSISGCAVTSVYNY